MGIEISYMGTKRRLAGIVSNVVKRLPRGPILDAFSGMCAVGEAIAPARQIWTNDIQIFPSLVAKALFCSRTGPMPAGDLKDILEPHFQKNMVALEERFSSYLRKERKYFLTKTLEDVIAGNTELPYIGNDKTLENERKRLARKTTTFPYRLATITYAGSFFGAKQCMELDSLRYAADVALTEKSIDGEQKSWIIIALGQVLSRINNSTGQFAQYIKPNENNIHRVIGKRRRSLWDEFLHTVDSISPLGTQDWRGGNRCFQSDALQLLSEMIKNKTRPAIIYADPPYSDAQYSRYYHVLDVLAEYRYPPVTGIGRYPNKRFQTPFAHSNAVLDSMTKLVETSSKLNACLVLSYPTNGLFCKQGKNIIDLLKHYYNHTEAVYSEKQQHSTFGGPKAKPKISVIENIYVAFN